MNTAFRLQSIYISQNQDDDDRLQGAESCPTIRQLVCMKKSKYGIDQKQRTSNKRITIGRVFTS